LAGVSVLALIACLALGVAPASARHRPGCNTRCRQLGGVGSGPGQPAPKMALLRHRVHRHGHFVDVRLRCLRQHHPCRGVILLDARSSRAPELSRVNLDVPALRTWTIEIRLSKAGLAYLKAHQRVRGFLFLVYPDQVDSFRMTIIG
jgi:hypothetical protein